MQTLMRQPVFRSDSPSLPVAAQWTVDSGWTIGPGGTLLLGADRGGAREELPASEISLYEYESNDADVLLCDLTDEDGGYLARAAARGMFFAVQLLRKAAGLPGTESLQAMVAVFVDVTDEDFAIQGVNVRFFTGRGDRIPWLDELEEFKLQAIAVLDLSDVPNLPEWARR